MGKNAGDQQTDQTTADGANLHPAVHLVLDVDLAFLIHDDDSRVVQAEIVGPFRRMQSLEHPPRFVGIIEHHDN
ncbi:hypothetical protein ACFLT5_02985 [Chloroflexota bacterium]